MPCLTLSRAAGNDLQLEVRSRCAISSTFALRPNAVGSSPITWAFHCSTNVLCALQAFFTKTAKKAARTIEGNYCQHAPKQASQTKALCQLTVPPALPWPLSSPPALHVLPSTNTSHCTPCRLRSLLLLPPAPLPEASRLYTWMQSS